MAFKILIFLYFFVCLQYLTVQGFKRTASALGNEQLTKSTNTFNQWFESQLIPYVTNIMKGESTANNKTIIQLISGHEIGLISLVNNLIPYIGEIFKGRPLDDALAKMHENDKIASVTEIIADKIKKAMYNSDMFTAFGEFMLNPVTIISNLLGVSNRCKSDLEDFITSLFEGPLTWGWQMLDSMGKPPSGITRGNLYWVGDFWQCLDIKVPYHRLKSNEGFIGEYCLTLIKINPTSNNTGTEDAKQYANILDLKVGVCFPSSCSANDVTQLFDKVEAFMGNTITVSAMCQTKERISKDATATIFTVILLTPVFLVIISTISIFLQEIFGFKPEKILPSKEKCLNTICSIFCVQKSWQYLFSQKQSSSREITCLYGIRAIMVLGVIWCHLLNINLEFSYYKNILQDFQQNDHFLDNAISFSYPVTMIFFILSGFLLTYSSSPPKTITSVIYNVFGRYIRINIPHLVVDMVLAGPMYYMVKAPVWPLLKIFHDKCNKDWLKKTFNLMTSECTVGSWYFPADFKIYTIGVLLLFFNVWKPYIYKVLHRLFFLVPFIYLCYSLGVNNLSLYMPHESAEELFRTFKDFSKQDQFINLWKFYYSFWIWIPGFACGMFSGRYFSLNLKRNYQEKKMCSRFHYLSGLAAFISSIVIFSYYSHFYFYHLNIPTFANIFYNFFANIIWTYSVHWIILHCVIYPSEVINKFLSCPVLIFLGKISYGLFILQTPIFLFYYNSMNEPKIASFENKIFDCVIVTLLLIFFSVLQYFIIEAPSSKLFYAIKNRHKAPIDKTNI